VKNLIFYIKVKNEKFFTKKVRRVKNLPKFELSLNELFSLEITEANRNSYTAVVLE